MQEPFINIGERVIVKRSLGSYCSHDFPYGFPERMRNEFGGKCVTIKQFHCINPEYCVRKAYNGDPYYYEIEEDGREFFWHSSMFHSPLFVKINSFK